MRLVLRRHTSPDALVEQDVLGVERLKLWVFCGSNLLRHEVVRPQVQPQAHNSYRTHPQPRHGHEQHEEVQPPLVAERNPEDLRPEAVSRHHRVGLFALRRVEGAEGVRGVTVFKQGVLHGRTVNRTQQCATQDACYAHHVERI